MSPKYQYLFPEDKPTKTNEFVRREQLAGNIKFQESVLIEELLYAMLSIEGQFIKRKYDAINSKYNYVVDASYFVFDSTLTQMLIKIFPICEYHDKIQVFIQSHSNFEYGLISQALCNALRFMDREYVLVVNMLDTEFEKGNLNLQK